MQPFYSRVRTYNYTIYQGLTTKATDTSITLQLPSFQ